MCLRPSAARPIGREGEGSVRARRSLARREKTFRWMVVVLAPLFLSLSLSLSIPPFSLPLGPAESAKPPTFREIANELKSHFSEPDAVKGT